MSETESALKVVVAADTSMSRDVVRFFLQASDEITIVADAASADDAAWMADKYGADAVVLHSGIAFDAVQDAVVAIRAAAPRARIVVVTPEGGGVPLPVDSRGADSYLEEGVGLADLAFVLTSLCRSPDIAIDLPPTFRAPEPTDPIIVVPEPELVMAGAPPATASSRPLASTAEPPTDDSSAASATSPSRRAGFLPLLAAASAFVIAVAFAMYRTPLENALFPDARTHFAGVDAGSRASDFLRSSHVRLTALAHSLDGGDATTAPALARQLVAERQRILASGGDVSTLDREIETTLRPMVRDAPAGVAVAVLAVIAPVASWANGDLNHLLLNGGPGISPTPPPNPGDSSGAGGAGTPTGTGDGVDVGGVPTGTTNGAGDGGTGTGDTGGSGSDTGGSGTGDTGGAGGQDGGGLQGGGPGGDGDADGTGATDGDGSTSSSGDSSGTGGTTEVGQGEAGAGAQAGASGEAAQGDASAAGGQWDRRRADQGGCEHPGEGGGKAYVRCSRPIKRHR